MTGAELRTLLRQADRNAAWLAKQVDRSRTQVVRWTEEGPPAEQADRIRNLLPPLPPLVRAKGKNA
jgi:hypothetical protein